MAQTPTKIRRSVTPEQPPATRRRPTKLQFWRRRLILALLAVTLVLFSYWGVTLVMYLRNPTYGVTMSARAAEWGRDHGFGLLVTWAEQINYDLNPPKVGGRPPSSAFGGGGATHTHLDAPPRVISPAGAWLPGEGVWHPVGREAAGHVPAMYNAFVREDTVHTSYIAGLVWMDPTLLSTTLYSGQYIPGPGTYSHSAPITPLASRTLAAAFNAGFRMQDARGGYYTDGRMIIPLRKGAASLVTYKNGDATVGAWGYGLTMSPAISSVRQNLDLIVDDSKANPSLSENDNYQWGATLGGGAYVWRSALGVTKTGALIYAAGPTLSITSLAQIMLDAGCVRAMELDINPDWVQYSIYHGPSGAVVSGANGTRLLSDMLGGPSRYFESWWSRDFVTVSLRPSALVATGKK